MLRLLALIVLFLGLLYAGCWITVAPIAITIRLIDWHNQWGGTVQDIAIGTTGLIGGIVIAALVTRYAAQRWRA